MSLAMLSHSNASSPIPSKDPGLVLGFQTPARNISTLLPLSPLAIASICSGLSALQGPAIKVCSDSPNPQSLMSTISMILTNKKARLL